MLRDGIDKFGIGNALPANVAAAADGETCVRRFLARLGDEEALSAASLLPLCARATKLTIGVERLTFRAFCALGEAIAAGAMPRLTELTVGKWFKSRGMMESSFFDMDLKISQKAIQIVDKWNAATSTDKHFQAINDLRPASLRPAASFQVIEPEVIIYGFPPDSPMLGLCLSIPPIT